MTAAPAPAPAEPHAPSRASAARRDPRPAARRPGARALAGALALLLLLAGATPGRVAANAPTPPALDTRTLDARLEEALAAAALRQQAADPARHVSRWDTFLARVRVAAWELEGLAAAPPRLTLLLHQDTIAGPGVDVATLEEVVRATLAAHVPDLPADLILQFAVELPGDARPVPLARFERMDPAAAQPSWPMLERPRRRAAAAPAAPGDAPTSAPLPTAPAAWLPPDLAPAAAFEEVRAAAPLAGEVILLGASHGLYVEEESRRWLWQRPLLFTSVEDLLTWSIVHPFLVPMLEDAGATVVTARQRDPVAWAGFDLRALDDGRVRRHGGEGRGAWEEHVRTRPGRVVTPRDGWVASGAPDAAVSAELDLAAWGPDAAAGGGPLTLTWFHPGELPTGAARVVVEFERNGVVVAARRFAPNTTRGYPQTLATWWMFPADRNVVRARRDPEDGRPVPFVFERLLVGPAEDAARVRELLEARPATPRPRELPASPPPWHQAALYGLTAMGVALDAPDRTEYQRDIIIRGELANAHLGAAPVAPRMYLAFHTDAGVAHEGLIGTLGLWRYVGEGGETTLAEGASRLASWRLTRALTDAIVADARRLHAPSWTRRAVQDRDFGEVRRPRVPSAIIELFAHQNFNDMRFGLDPVFRRDMARAIVRGVGAYVYPEPGDFVMAPRAVERWAARPAGPRDAARAVAVRWEPAAPDPGDDPAERPRGVALEASADGRHFEVVAVREVAPGAAPDAWEAELAAWPEALRAEAAAGGWLHLRLRAGNEGGWAAPSPVLSVRWGAGGDGTPHALEVTGFLRLATPRWTDEEGRRGFVVGEPAARGRLDPAFLGPQLEFDPDRRFQSNELPGWGASVAHPEVAALRRGVVTADWSRLATDRVDHPEPPEAEASLGGEEGVAAATTAAFAAWQRDDDVRAGAAGGWAGVRVRYLARHHATSPPPPHATGAAGERWRATHPEWLPAGARARLARALEAGATAEVVEPGAAAARVLAGAEELSGLAAPGAE